MAQVSPARRPPPRSCMSSPLSLAVFLSITAMTAPLGAQSGNGAEVLLASGPGRARERLSRESDSLLSLGNIYQAAKDSSPRSAAARAQASAARARVSPARTFPDPQIQLGLMNYAIPDLQPMEAIGMAQIQLMQMVPTAGKLGLAGRVAQAQAAASEWRARGIEWDIRMQSAMAFYELYVVDRGLEVARGTLRLLQDVLRTVEAMYRVGDGRQTDVLRAQVEIARMVEDTVRMHTMRTGLAARLNALLNRRIEA